MYPFSLLASDTIPYPIFGSEITGKPFCFDYSCAEFLSVDPRNMDAMMAYNHNAFRKNHTSWGLGGYLENRSHMLQNTHIRAEGRIYHLGIDLTPNRIVPIYSPFDGFIHERGYEPGDGNYGGYVIVQYTMGGDFFFVLF